MKKFFFKYSSLSADNLKKKEVIPVLKNGLHPDALFPTFLGPFFLEQADRLGLFRQLEISDL